MRRLAALGGLEALTQPEAVDVRRHVEAAALLALGDVAGALAVVADPGKSSAEESKALQWAARAQAEAVLGALQPATRRAVAALLADDGRLLALEALILRRAWARALAASSNLEAATAVASAEDRRATLRACLAKDPAWCRLFDALYPRRCATATPGSAGWPVGPA